MSAVPYPLHHEKAATTMTSRDSRRAGITIEDIGTWDEIMAPVDEFTVVFKRDSRWWVGWIEELPGANTQGETLDEAIESLKESAQFILEEGPPPNEASRSSGLPGKA